eukprot:5497912-Pleurochrysis_carterae.AAC.2
MVRSSARVSADKRDQTHGAGVDCDHLHGSCCGCKSASTLARMGSPEDRLIVASDSVCSKLRRPRPLSTECSSSAERASAQCAADGRGVPLPDTVRLVALRCVGGRG